MEIFAMHAQVLGESRLVAVSNDGSGLTIDRDGDFGVAHSVDQAISSAKAYIGELLMKAQHPEKVWELDAAHRHDNGALRRAAADCGNPARR